MKKFFLSTALLLCVGPALAQPASHTYASTDVVKVQTADGGYANALVSSEVTGVTGGAAALSANNTWTGNNTFTKTLTLGGDALTSGTAPTPTGTGTPTIVATSTDTAGEVTAGSSATSVIITFATTKTNAPFCVVRSQAQIASFAYTISTTAISITQTATSANLIDYICVQH